MSNPTWPVDPGMREGPYSATPLNPRGLTAEAKVLPPKEPSSNDSSPPNLNQDPSFITRAQTIRAEVAEALGHRTLVMAKRYSHQTGEHVRSTFERLADKLTEPESG